MVIIMKKFFNNAAVKLQKFMYGRYGTDSLYRALLWIFLAITLLAAILGRTVNSICYTVLSVIGWVVIIYAFYRFFSKNIEKRRAENAKWLKMTGGIRKKFKLLGNRIKFRKTHVFRTCPRCKAVLRMKKEKGKHEVTCPHCGTKFKFSVRF